ncbi:MAG: WD40 repeat domain-containing protein [Rhodospirillales bacterium]|nr:WD40 repeat domain-containing protein [Rhodospirillales bacterium]
MHNGPTTCLAFDHLGRLYSGSYDCQVIAWNATLDDVRWNARHDGLVNGITATESLLLSVGADRLVRAWDLDSGGEKTKSFAPRVDDLNIIRVSADQSLIVASGDEGKICVYDASDTKLRWERQSCLPQTFGESIEAMDLVQLPNGEEAIIAGDGSGNVVLLDIDGQIIDRARLPGTAECCCYSPWDRSVVFGLADGSIISLAIAGLEVKAARREHRSTVKAVAASEDGHIASASYDGTLILWHGGSLEQLERVRLTAPNARGWARGLAFNPHRPSELAVTALDARPFIRDMSSKQVISGSGVAHPA